MAAAIAKRFQQAVEKGENSQKLRAILDLGSKDDLIAWTDDDGLDLLHHCIVQENAEAADLLLKQGYFARPHEPRLSPYLHLAAALGTRSLISVLVQERPDDFRIASQPLLIPDSALVGKKDGGGGAGVGVNGGGGGGSSQTPAASADSSLPSARTPNRSSGRPPSSAGRPASSKLTSAQNKTKSSVTASSAAPSSAARSSRKTPGSQPSPTKEVAAIKGGQNASSSLPPSSSAASSTSSFSSSVSSATQSPKTKLTQAGLDIDGSEPVRRTPLNVAARAKHVECVRLLLDLCVLKAHPEAPCKGYLTLAALTDDPVALNLLLKVSYG